MITLVTYIWTKVHANKRTQQSVTPLENGAMIKVQTYVCLQQGTSSANRVQREKEATKSNEKTHKRSLGAEREDWGELCFPIGKGIKGAWARKYVMRKRKCKRMWWDVFINNIQKGRKPAKCDGSHLQTQHLED